MLREINSFHLYAPNELSGLVTFDKKYWEKPDTPIFEQEGWDPQIVRAIRKKAQLDYELELLWQRFLTPFEHRLMGSSIEKYEDKPSTPIIVRDRLMPIPADYYRQKGSTYNIMGHHCIDKGTGKRQSGLVEVVLAKLNSSGIALDMPYPVNENLVLMPNL